MTAAASDFIADGAVEVRGVSGAAKFGEVEVFLSVGGGAEFFVLESLAELATILPSARFGAEVFGAAEGGGVGGPRADGVDWVLSEFVDGGADLTGESAGHFEERPRGEEGDDFDGDAEDEGEAIFGGGDDSPADERAGAKEDGEGGVEDEHLGEGLFPFGEPGFGVGKEHADEGEGADHDEDVDEGLAEGDGEVSDDDGDDGAEEDGNEGEKEGAEAATGTDGEAG